MAGSHGLNRGVSVCGLPSLHTEPQRNTPATVAVVGVAHAGCGFELALCVPLVVGHHTVAVGVARSIVTEDRQMVVAVGSGVEAAFFGTAGVIGIIGGGDVVEIAPSVKRVAFSPALRFGMTSA